MSNLFSLVLGAIIFFPSMLFGFDLFLIQSVSAGLETYASALTIRTSNQGIKDSHVLEAQEDGYRLICINGCQNVQLGQTQTFVIEKDYSPIFISSEIITLTAKRSYLIGYY